MDMNGYFTLHRSLEIEPRHHILNFDRAGSQGIHKQDAPVKTGGSRCVGWQPEGWPENPQAVWNHQCLSTSGPSSSICNSVSTLFIHSAFFVMIFPFQYIAPKSFCLVWIRSLGCLRPFSLYLLVVFSFVVSFLFCLYSLVMPCYLFSLQSFACNFFISVFELYFSF